MTAAGGFEIRDPTAAEAVARWQTSGDPEVFISFRSKVPEDVQGAGLIYQSLISQFGVSTAFCSMYSIVPGGHSGDIMNAALHRVKVLVPIIGRNWAISLPRREGQRGHPWVVHEIHTALTRNLKILPVVVTNRRRIEGGLPRKIAKVAEYQTMALPLVNEVVDADHPQIDPHDVDGIFRHSDTIAAYIGAILCPEILMRRVRQVPPNPEQDLPLFYYDDV